MDWLTCSVYLSCWAFRRKVLGSEAVGGVIDQQMAHTWISCTCCKSRAESLVGDSKMKLFVPICVKLFKKNFMNFKVNRKLVPIIITPFFRDSLFSPELVLYYSNKLPLSLLPGVYFYVCSWTIARCLRAPHYRRRWSLLRQEGGRSSYRRCDVLRQQ